MAVTLIEKPEREAESSQAGGSGSWHYLARVTGTSTPEADLIAAIVSATGYFWYNLAVKNVRISEVGIDLYEAEVSWEYEVPDAAAQSPTGSPGATDGPGGTAPSGTPQGITSDSQQIGTDVSFEVGGRPPKILTSRSVVATEKAGGGAAPDAGRLLNFNRETNEVDGVEVDDADTTMTVFRIFDYVTMSDIKLWLDAMWHVNQSEWFGQAAGDLLFSGLSVPDADQDGRRRVTFRFGLRRTRTIAANELRDDVGSELPVGPVAKAGWDYLEIGYENATDATAGVLVAKPAWLRVHEIFPAVEFSTLGIGG